MEWTWMLVTIAAAVAGGLIFMRLKITGGALLGSILFVAVLNILTEQAFFPPQFMVMAKITTGAYIGASIRKKDVHELRFIVLPTIFMLVTMTAYNIITGFGMQFIGNIKLSTALFATAPGGIMEMTLIGSEMGAEGSIVAAVQICRLVTIVMFSPLLLRLILKKRENRQTTQGHNAKAVADNKRNDSGTDGLNKKKKVLNLTLTLCVAGIAGYIGDLSGIPAGAISFSMIAAATLNVTTGRGFMPLPLRRVLQMLSGALVGARITMGDIRVVTQVALPVLVVMVGYMGLNVLMGVIISRKGRVSLTTALFGTAAGGMAEMTLIASDLGGDTAKVATMQFARNVCVVSVYPIIIKGLLLLMGAQ